MAMLVTLKRVGRSIQLWIGDLLNYSEDRFGEVVAQFLEEWEYGTLANWAWVARKVTPELRQAVTPRGEVLHYEHYRTVAPLPPAEQKEWLTRAVAEGWSGRRLAQEVSGGSGGVLYDGPGQVFRFQEFDRWVVRLPPGVELQASAGDEVRVIVRSKEV